MSIYMPIAIIEVNCMDCWIADTLVQYVRYVVQYSTYSRYSMYSRCSMYNTLHIYIYIFICRIAMMEVGCIGLLLDCRYPYVRYVQYVQHVQYVQ